LKAATTDPDTISRWWGRWPQANIAVRTGATSGLVVLDVDPRHGGNETVRELVRQHGEWPDGPIVRTGSDGWHGYFAHPGEPIRNSAGRIGPGLDVRGDGGYIIAPPSRHASGACYRWEDLLGELPPMPEWLLTLARQPVPALRPEQHEPIRLDRAISAWARSALDGEAGEVRSAVEGARNTTLNRAAFCLGQIVGAGILDAGLVERVLLESATGTGLGEREARTTVRSGVEAGMNYPRQPATRTPTPPAREGVEASGASMVAEVALPEQ
jgi:hypothetical protein